MRLRGPNQECIAFSFCSLLFFVISKLSDDLALGNVVFWVSALAAKDSGLVGYNARKSTVMGPNHPNVSESVFVSASSGNCAFVIVCKWVCVCVCVSVRVCVCVCVESLCVCVWMLTHFICGCVHVRVCGDCCICVFVCNNDKNNRANSSNNDNNSTTHSPQR